MKKPKKWNVLLGAIVLLGLSGCSDDDDANMMGGTVDPAQATAAVGQAMNQFVVPLFTVIGAIAQAGITRGTCDEPIGCSFGGDLQVCADAINFNMCNEGLVIDGAIMVDNLSLGAVTVDLLVGDTTLSGTGNIAPASCQAKGDSAQLLFGSFAVSAGGDSASVTGSIQQCDDPFPNGDMLLTTDLLAIAIFLDGTNIATATATDLSSGETVVSCSADLSQIPVVPSCS